MMDFKTVCYALKLLIYPLHLLELQLKLALETQVFGWYLGGTVGFNWNANQKITHCCWNDFFLVISLRGLLQLI